MYIYIYITHTHTHTPRGMLSTVSFPIYIYLGRVILYSYQTLCGSLQVDNGYGVEIDDKQAFVLGISWPN